MKNQRVVGSLLGSLLGLVLAVGGSGCRPGYIKADKLEAQGQGPSACAKSCEDLGMRMAALVLVGDDLPGCVCQPVTTRPPSAPGPAVPPNEPAPPGTMPQPDSANEGAAASTTAYVVLAAAAAARERQRKQQQAQQLQKK
jgi:hypothetical protein